MPSGPGSVRSIDAGGGRCEQPRRGCPVPSAKPRSNLRVEGHQVDERLRLDRVESIDTALASVEQAAGDGLGHHDAQVDIRQTAQPVPLAEQQRPIGSVDVEPQVRGDDGKIRAGRVDDRARRRGRRSCAGAGHHARLALLQERVAIEFLLDQRDDLFTAPDAVTQEIRDFLQRARPAYGLVADIEAAIADRGVREPDARAKPSAPARPSAPASGSAQAGDRSPKSISTNPANPRAMQACALDARSPGDRPPVAEPLPSRASAGTTR